jgi:sugar/nucleoside kinase (ribokinase family)
VVLSHALNVVRDSSAPKAFYFDRVSPAIIRMAAWARAGGSLVVFEPSSIGDEPIVRRAVELCHILKCSDERLGHVSDVAEARQPSILVQTRGADGLRVRWRARWSELPAFHTPHVVDAAGSGDWCAAGILHVLAQMGASALDDTRKIDVERALRLGQALAAVNCGFEGARGVMYALSRERLNRLLGRLIGGEGSLPDDNQADRRRPVDLCRLCAEVSRAAASNTQRIS